MASDILKQHKSWIIDYLLPKLFEQQKLVVCKHVKQHAKIKTIDVKPMSMDNTFMLTYCYFVKISIEIQPEHVQCKDSEIVSGEKELDFVIKVFSIVVH